VADNVAITAGSGVTVGTDEVTDATLGTVQVQFVKIMDGTLNSTNKLFIGTNGAVRTGMLMSTDGIDQAGATLTYKRAFSNITASATDSSIVASVATKKIRVVCLTMVTGATATNITFNSKPAGAGTAISPLFANAANGGAVLPLNPMGWFESNAGEGLTATTSAGSSIGVILGYVEA
jgi:hypothetical protein